MVDYTRPDAANTRSGNKVLADPTERLHDRLRKLLDLSKSAATEVEASTAAALLSKFLTEHNLSVADLEQRGGVAAPGVHERGHDLGKAAFKWKLDLAEGIAEFYYCHPLVDRKLKSVVFVGRPDNVEALTMLYSWVIEQVKQIATVERRKHFDTAGEHIDPLRWQVAFGEGCVERLIDRLRELKARQAEDMSRDEYGGVTALATHHQSEIGDYMEATYGWRNDGKLTKREQEWEAKRQRARQEQDELRIQCEAAGNMQPYWDKYPREHPDYQAQARQRLDEYLEAERKREARNERRRARAGSGYSSLGRPEKQVDERQEEQRSTARVAGERSASKVNLQPFITGNVDRSKGKVGE